MQRVKKILALIWYTTNLFSSWVSEGSIKKEAEKDQISLSIEGFERVVYIFRFWMYFFQQGRDHFQNLNSQALN